MNEHAHNSGIYGPGLGSASLDARVSTVETRMDALQESVDRVERESIAGREEINRKLDEQTGLLITKMDRMATSQAASGKTNWGVIFSGAGVLLVVIGAIGVAWLRPSEVVAAAHERRLERMDERWERTFEMAVRADERDKFRGGAGAERKP